MFKKIIKEIEAADSIIVVGHVRPDGDCYGCQVGLKTSITDTFPNKKVYIVGQGLPFFFDKFGPMDEVDKDIVENSLIIIVDLSELKRIDSEIVKQYGKHFVVIDHHIISTPIPYEYVVDENASSACELVTKLIFDAGWHVSAKCATGLYLGIITDTARFQYLNNFPEMFRISALLCEKGANPKEINRTLSLAPEAKLRVQGYALTHYKKTDKGVIYLHLTKENLRELNANPAVGSLIINLLGNIVGYPIWATFIETEENTLVMEFRSNKYSVREVAAKHGGGGHRVAAGLTLTKYSLSDIDTILDELGELIQKKDKQYVGKRTRIRN